MKIAPFYILFMLITSCSNPNPYSCKVDQSVIATNDSIWDRNKDGYDDFLKSKKEPKLESLQNKSFRLIFSEPFDRGYVIYRLQQTNDGGLLTYSKLYNRYHHRKNEPRDSTFSKKISQKQWESVENAFNSNCYWTMPLDIDDQGLDGQTFILEAFDPDAENPTERNYAIVSRWSPDKGTDFKTICDAIQDLYKGK